MTATVTLSWPDPDDAAEFLSIRRDLRTQGWLPDPSAEALTELVMASEVVKDGAEEGSG